MTSPDAAHPSLLPSPPQLPPFPPPRLMLLSLWAEPGGAWLARLAGPGGQVREFRSPFELARYLARPVPGPDQPAAGGPGGLR